MGDGVDHFASAVDAIAAGIEFRVAGLQRVVHRDAAAVVGLQAENLLDEVALLLLAERFDDHVALEDELATRDRLGRGSAGTVGFAEFHADAFDAFDRGLADDPLRSGQEVIDAAILLGDLVLVIVRGHFGFCAAVQDHDHLRAESFGLRRGVHGSVARADDRNAAAHAHVAQLLVFEFIDERDGVYHAGQVFTGNAEVLGLAETDPNENGVAVLGQLLDLDILPNFAVLFEFHPDVLDELHFLEGFLGGHFVAGDAVGVEAARLVVLVVNRDGVTELREIKGAGQARWSATDAGDLLAIRFGRLEHLLGLVPIRVKPIDRKALEPADLDRLGVALVIDTGAFAQRTDGTNAGAAHAEDVRVEDLVRAAAHVARGDLLDKRGNVDVCRAGARARRVETEQAPLGFERGIVRREWGGDVGKILLVLGVGQLRGKILHR